jgi:agmatine deiminase
LYQLRIVDCAHIIISIYSCCKMTKRFLTAFLATFLTLTMYAQQRQQVVNTPSKLLSRADVLESPPVYEQLRTPAEWEEVQALLISWSSYPAILKQVVRAAREEVQVIILSGNPQQTQNYLLTANDGGAAFTDLANITILPYTTNSIWMRDYAANSVYANEVGQLFLADWMYNRPRPMDDTSPEVIADQFGLELYGMTSAPYNMMNTGGNFMVDGFGTAFASELVLEENDGNGEYNLNYPNHTEAQIDDIHAQFMGVERYIKMPVLPYDGIHHIDMHMKLLDEETLLVGEYPEGVADGPQINANIEYVLSQYMSKWDTPYKVIRIPMPPSVQGNHPDNNGAYRTYTNGVFVNNTIIIPTYREQYDTTAVRIWSEACPGYEIVGVDCDNMGTNLISLGGAIHCITHSVAAEHPLLISHQPLRDRPYTNDDYIIHAYMNHVDGVAEGKVFWRTAGSEEFEEVSLSSTDGLNWYGTIPAQAAGTVIQYYLYGRATTGKEQWRPMPAPEGYWTFKILEETVSMEELSISVLNRVFPNPASAITCIELNIPRACDAELFMTDVTGRIVLTIKDGAFESGVSKYFIDAAQLVAGLYQVVFLAEGRLNSLPLLVE